MFFVNFCLLYNNVINTYNLNSYIKYYLFNFLNLIYINMIFNYFLVLNIIIILIYFMKFYYSINFLYIIIKIRQYYINNLNPIDIIIC